jgi:hypothetical protein
LDIFCPSSPGILEAPGQQGLRLGQDDLAAALQVAEQPLAIAERDVLLPRAARAPSPAPRRRPAPGSGAQLAVQLGVLLAHLLDRRLGLLLEVRLAAVDVVEAARDLAGQLDVRDLVLAHRHQAGR